LNQYFSTWGAALNSELVGHGSLELLNIVQVHLTPSTAHLNYAAITLPHGYHQLENHEQVRFLDLVFGCGTE
jgi:hypothetical protein